MKKFFSLLLCALLICACFSACGGNSPEEENSLGNSPEGNSSPVSSSGDDPSAVKILVDLDCTHTTGSTA